MIPETPDYLNADNATKKYTILPTYTYKVDVENRKIEGNIDGREAVMQFIQKVLDIGKYDYEIYDWYYGNELQKLIGKSTPFVIAEIPRIVKEALLTDDRIIDVKDFIFSQTNIDSIHVICTVNTVYGIIPYDLEVAV